MRKIILYSAMSLNGKIARANGDVSWLDGSSEMMRWLKD